MNPRLVDRDMPPCTPSHGGGLSAETFINGAQGHFVQHDSVPGQIWDLIRGLTIPGYFLRHARRGSPTYADYPGFRHGLHHQMHVTQIRRAWEGGLRLMTAIAVQNVGVEFIMSKLVDGVTNPSTERQVLDAQVCATRQVTELNQDWMQIAYSAAQARDIISRGKLAIILAVEMDQLGQLDGFDSVQAEIDYLWSLGVRQVTPIHSVNNALGGAAVFEPAYNTLNDLLNRGDFNAHKETLTAPPVFFDILDSRPNVYAPIPGMTNKKGLTPKGTLYIRALMRRGMLVALEHMSNASVEDVYQLVGQHIAETGFPECRDLRPDSSDDCFERAYLLVVSHAHFRQLSAPDAAVNAFRPSEYEVSDRQTDMIRRTGGLAGQFVAEDPVHVPSSIPALAFHNDCAGSSKRFAHSLAWEKVERVSGAPKQDWFSPLALPCEVICRGLCPASPDAGAPPRR